GGIVIGDSKAGTVTMTNANITGNNAGTNGGGVYVKIGTFKMDNSAISKNTATSNGGGVYVGNGGNVSSVFVPATFTMTNGTIYGTGAGDLANTAAIGGAALFKTAKGVATLNDTDQGTAELKIDGNIP
ncbi:MAG: hypothetical protein LBJ86_01920, partial [Spirochaetaceae bacterium]|nr:hypothetical protein [Spirochaetaceae bacterium]